MMSNSDVTRREAMQNIGGGAAGVALAGAMMSTLTRCGLGGEQPNILWLISEDTSPDYGCYGESLVQSPNVDGLAAEGIRFTRTYTTAPVCSASRSAFMTGMYQTSIGAHQHRTLEKKPLPSDVQVITEYFREAGYFTSNCAGLSFDTPGKTDWDFAVEDEAFDGTHWSQRKEGQPFFSQVNFSMTHRVFKRDPERPIDPNKVNLPPYYPDHPITRRDWADYLESIQVLDNQIGEVLQKLEDDGLAENTIVFYFGDHGRPHMRGKQWLYEGGIHVPFIVRFPDRRMAGTTRDDLVSALDFAPTAMKLAGIKPPKHLQGQDILSDSATGRKYMFSARDRCDETFDRIRCVSNGRYKLIRNYHPDRPYTQMNVYKRNQYPVVSLMEILSKQERLTPAQMRWMAPTRPAEELYDLETDPYEIHNLVNDSAQKSVLDDLRNQLDRWVVETGDMGENPEPPEEMEHWVPFMQQQWEKWMTAKGLSPDITDEEYLRWWEEQLF
jgi:N-sulfoglucosamine sulfohydrolase